MTGERTDSIAYSRSGRERAPLTYHVGYRVTRAFFSLFYRPVVRGLELVPPTGGLLVVANHQSHFDPPLIGVAIMPKRPLHFVARATLFDNPVFGAIISRLNAFPIDQSGRGDVKAIRTILAHLEKGKAVMVFPEGARSPDGAMHEFKRGTELLLRRSECHVLPVAVEGAYDAYPRHRKWPRLFGQRLGVNFGRPIPHDELMSGQTPPMERLAREIQARREEIADELCRLTGGKIPARLPERAAPPAEEGMAGA